MIGRVWCGGSWFEASHGSLFSVYSFVDLFSGCR